MRAECGHRGRPLCLESLETRLALATLYVSPIGSDSNLGSSDAPWQTLQRAADAVQPGDTVVVRAGQYVGFDLRSDGAAQAPITFSAESGAVINVRNARTPDGINLEGADHIVIEGFTVAGVPRAGIRSVLNHHVTIRNNQADSNGRWGIFTGFSDDLLIENNITSRSQAEHGIYVSNSGDRPVIRNNVTWGNRAAGIHMNGDISQGGDGIISSAVVEGNKIYDNGVGGGSGINADGVQNSRFQNNLLYGNHASGISLFRIDGGGPSSGNVVVNNTIVQAADARWALNIQNASVNSIVLNNILFNNHPSRGSIDISSDSLSGFTSDYNVVMNRFTTNDSASVLTLPQWRAATGQDQHSIIATPAQLFVNAGAGDYHLAATSPALDVGTATNAPALDFERDSRPSGAGFDIGADERMAATPANRAPQAMADSVSTTEDAFVEFNPLANDVDPDGDSLALSSLAQPANGMLTQLPNGQLRYTPQSNFSGNDSFTYQATDGQASSTVTTVVISVAAVNDAPIAIVPSGQTIAQDAPLVFSSSRGNALSISDLDASTGSLQATLAVSNGALTLGQTSGVQFTAGDGTADSSMSFRGTLNAINAALNGLTFVPNSGFSGPASITLSIDDLGNTGSGGAQVHVESISVTVEPETTETPPTGITLSNGSVRENSGAGTVIGTLLVTDPDQTSGHSLSLIDNAGNRFALSGNNLIVGAGLDYEAAASHSVTVRATDGDGLSIERTFTVNVENVQEGARFNVQRGANQRSYIRYIDMVFEDSTGLTELIEQDRVRLNRVDSSGGSGSDIDLSGKLRASGNQLTIDFGAQGIGGNRSSAAGNGAYSLQLDLDGDGAFETLYGFHRLLGDTNGDRAVNTTDLRNVLRDYGRRSAGLNGDVNGDGSVNLTDVVITNLYLGTTTNSRTRLVW